MSENATMRMGDAGYVVVTHTKLKQYKSPVTSVYGPYSQKKAKNEAAKTKRAFSRDEDYRDIEYADAWVRPLLTEDMFGLLTQDEKGKWVPYPYEPRTGDVVKFANDQIAIRRDHKNGPGWDVSGAQSFYYDDWVVPFITKVLHREELTVVKS